MRSPLKAPERQNNRQQDKTRTATNGGEEIKAWEFIDILSWIQVGLRQRTESEPVPKKIRRNIWGYTSLCAAE